MLLGSLYRVAAARFSAESMYRVLIGGTGIVGGVAIQLAYNKCVTGSPLTFGYTYAVPWDKWGFGTARHTPLKGLWNTLLSVSRMWTWGAPGAVELALYSTVTREKRTLFLAMIVSFFILFYAGYWTTGPIFSSRSWPPAPSPA
jgi:hypothetical protein